MNNRIALRSYVLADYRCYLTHYVAERVGLDADPVVIRCGVDHSMFRPGPKPESEKIRIGVIGRYAERKGLPVFFKSWEALSDLHDRAEIVIWPAGADDRFQPPKGGSIYPVCDDNALAGFYRSLDIFVFPTLFEGFGLPPLEAMACGIPVVLTDSGGIREFAKDGKNCLMVPAGKPEPLANAVRRAVESPELRNSLANAGIDTAQPFTWEDTVERFHQGVLNAMDHWKCGKGKSTE
jgi:glycosyltransferase involved in cell wall biosynthesis